MKNWIVSLLIVVFSSSSFADEIFVGEIRDLAENGTALSTQKITDVLLGGVDFGQQASFYKKEDGSLELSKEITGFYPHAIYASELFNIVHPISLQAYAQRKGAQDVNTIPADIKKEYQKNVSKALTEAYIIALLSRILDIEALNLGFRTTVPLTWVDEALNQITSGKKLEELKKALDKKIDEQTKKTIDEIKSKSSEINPMQEQIIKAQIRAQSSMMQIQVAQSAPVISVSLEPFPESLEDLKKSIYISLKAEQKKSARENTVQALFMRYNKRLNPNFNSIAYGKTAGDMDLWDPFGSLRMTTKEELKRAQNLLNVGVKNFNILELKVGNFTKDQVLTEEQKECLQLFHQTYGSAYERKIKKVNLETKERANYLEIQKNREFLPEEILKEVQTVFSKECKDMPIEISKKTLSMPKQEQMQNMNQELGMRYQFIQKHMQSVQIALETNRALIEVNPFFQTIAQNMMGGIQIQNLFASQDENQNLVYTFWLTPEFLPLDKVEEIKVLHQLIFSEHYVEQMQQFLEKLVSKYKIFVRAKPFSFQKDLQPEPVQTSFAILKIANHPTSYLQLMDYHGDNLRKKVDEIRKKGWIEELFKHHSLKQFQRVFTAP